VNVGIINHDKYHVIPRNEGDMAGDSQVLLGRKFKKSNNIDKIFVYLGEFDEYAAPEL